jgi:hypothetical protein
VEGIEWIRSCSRGRREGLSSSSHSKHACTRAAWKSDIKTSTCNGEGFAGGGSFSCSKGVTAGGVSSRASTYMRSVSALVTVSCSEGGGGEGR